MKNQNLKNLIQMAMLCAIAYVFILIIRFPIFPATPYLIYDAGDIPLLIGSFLFGPIAGLGMVVAVSGLQAIFLSGDGLVGFAMHVIASGALVMVAGFIYRKFQSRKSAMVGLLVGTVSMAAVMIPANLIFTVHFYGVPTEVVVETMPFTIGFNLIKAAINSVVVALIYKPLSRLFKRQKVASKQTR